MSDFALHLIGENKKNRALSLDIGNCGLTELPQELEELIWLEELILSSKWNTYNSERRGWETKTSQNTGPSNCITNIEGIEKP